MATYVQEFQGKIKAKGADVESVTASGTITAGGAITAPSFNGKATSAGTADSAAKATNATNDGNGVNIAANYARQTGNYSGMTVGNADKAKSADSATTATSATSATNATNAQKATSDANGNNIANTYAKQNGEYPNMTVGKALSADSAPTGLYQHNIFFNGIVGINNKSSSVFATIISRSSTPFTADSLNEYLQTLGTGIKGAVMACGLINWSDTHTIIVNRIMGTHTGIDASGATQDAGGLGATVNEIFQQDIVRPVDML